MNPDRGHTGAPSEREDVRARDLPAMEAAVDAPRLRVVGEPDSLAAAWSAAGPAVRRRHFSGLEERLRAAARSVDAAAKRALNIVLASVGMLLTSPAWVVLPVLIKLEDGGPVFYGQDRAGRDGRRFTSWKFRSMRPLEAEDGPLLRADLEEHRITRVGKVMRRTALDELPQLWNILRGDMSLVGPRALLPEERVGGPDDDGRVSGAPADADPAPDVSAETEAVRLEDLPGYEERQSVRPGLTGLAQVHASREITHRQKFRFDLLYVRRRTLWLDLRLIVRSVLISLGGRWPEVGTTDAS